MTTTSVFFWHTSVMASLTAWTEVTKARRDVVRSNVRVHRDNIEANPDKTARGT